ncbi:VirB9 Type IV secretory pathway, VirB9 components [uncultured Caudovirales phage]|uniref:VirB9 Type IV secretory pathway, VirB9 components n=1 Tax=uncultured Caudovirales phage TaxID=2100421 RepID=A0A6J5R5Q3_9CAUD|nr:VirB9 Type IV secretory pathway, VirB9 components [uncultured Caudovirales phage]
MVNRTSVSAAALMCSVSFGSVALADQHVPPINRASASASANSTQSNAQASAQFVPSEGGAATGNPADLSPDQQRALTKMPPRVDVAPPPGALSQKERQVVKISKKSASRLAIPRADADGYVSYAYGSTQPVIVCAVAKICLLTLPIGEIITGSNDKDVGHFKLSDTVNWTVEPLLSGSGRNLQTSVSIRPNQANLEAVLVLPTTGHIYSISLRSTEHDWMPLIRFYFPDVETRNAQEAYRKQVNAAVPQQKSKTASGSGINSISFGYEIFGDAPWRPTQVYTDGQRTVIAFPSGVASNELPVLVGLADDGGWFSSPTETVIGSRMLPDGRMLVDAVLQRAALVTGVGSNQVEVTITKTK